MARPTRLIDITGLRLAGIEDPRFFPALRIWAAVLAGVNQMAWPKFLVFNAAGAVLWETFSIMSIRIHLLISGTSSNML